MDIPVLFFPFSRPQYARQVFDVIKKVKPKKFYFYCDKARDGNEEELKNNNIIRDYKNEIDWECDFKTWFRDENIGVYKSIFNAIDWFFENEEFGIILEEDCLPSIAFFDFCRQLLPKYEDDQRVWFISGNSFVDGYDFKGYDYIFSAISYQWGWATWASRWKKIQRNGFYIKNIIEQDVFYNIYGSRKIANFSNENLLKMANREELYTPISWDYIFQMTMHVNNGVAIVPAVNLVANIGVSGANSKEFNKKIHNKVLPANNKYIISKPSLFVMSDMKYVHKVYFKVIMKMNMKGRIKLVLKFLMRK